jgi:hypothetical protein
VPLIGNFSGRSHCYDDGVLCAVKSSLLDYYKEATAAYSAAVKQLQKSIDMQERSAREDLRKIAEDRRSQSEQSRLELEQHIRSHGC